MLVRPGAAPACLFSREGCSRCVPCHVRNVGAATGHAFTVAGAQKPRRRVQRCRRATLTTCSFGKFEPRKLGCRDLKWRLPARGVDSQALSGTSRQACGDCAERGGREPEIPGSSRGRRYYAGSCHTIVRGQRRPTSCATLTALARRHSGSCRSSPPAGRPPTGRPWRPLFFCGRALAFARAACFAAAEAGCPCGRPSWPRRAPSGSRPHRRAQPTACRPADRRARRSRPPTLSAAAAGFLPRRRRCFLALSAVPFGSSDAFCAASGVPGCSGTTALAVSGAAQASTASSARSCIALSTQAAIFGTVFAVASWATYDANTDALANVLSRSVSNERCKIKCWPDPFSSVLQVASLTIKYAPPEHQSKKQKPAPTAASTRCIKSEQRSASWAGRRPKRGTAAPASPFFSKRAARRRRSGRSKRAAASAAAAAPSSARNKIETARSPAKMGGSGSQ